MDALDRLVSTGTNTLSRPELIALVLQGAAPRREAPELLAAKIVSQAGAALRAHDALQLAQLPGIGLSRAARLVAGLELGRRAVFEKVPPGVRYVQAELLAARFWPRLANLDHEEFWALLLSSRLEEIAAVRLSSGGLSLCSVLPSDAFRAALLHRAACVAFAHNHPSGCLDPSGEDLRLQLHLEEAAHTLGIRVIDHLVIARGGFFSARSGACGRPEPLASDPSLS